VAATGGHGEQAAGVTHGQGGDALLSRPGDDRVGGFVVGLPDTPTVAALDYDKTRPTLAVTARASV
jgi:hypothetical protein